MTYIIVQHFFATIINVCFQQTDLWGFVHVYWDFPYCTISSMFSVQAHPTVFSYKRINIDITGSIELSNGKRCQRCSLGYMLNRKLTHSTVVTINYIINYGAQNVTHWWYSEAYVCFDLLWFLLKSGIFVMEFQDDWCLKYISSQWKKLKYNTICLKLYTLFLLWALYPVVWNWNWWSVLANSW